MPSSDLSEVPAGRFMIVGRTASGRTFRPSDWAERLAGIMAPFRPGPVAAQAHLAYSPYVVPGEHQGVKCVIVDPRIREVEAMALSFLLNFARDNELEVQSLPSESKP